MNNIAEMQAMAQNVEETLLQVKGQKQQLLTQKREIASQLSRLKSAFAQARERKNTYIAEVKQKGAEYQQHIDACNSLSSQASQTDDPDELNSIRQQIAMHQDAANKARQEGQALFNKAQEQQQIMDQINQAMTEIQNRLNQINAEISQVNVKCERCANLAQAYAREANQYARKKESEQRAAFERMTGKKFGSSAAAQAASWCSAEAQQANSVYNRFGRIARNFMELANMGNEDDFGDR